MYAKGNGKGICLESRYPCDYTHIPGMHVLQTLPPLAAGAQQHVIIDPTLDLCTRYPLWLGGLRLCGIRSLPDTSTHGQYWESKPRPSDLESNALTTWPHVPLL